LRLASIEGPAPTGELALPSPTHVRSAALSADTAAQETALEEAARFAGMDTDDAVAAQPLPRPKIDKHLHALPRGSSQGTFLHGILEWAAVQSVQADDGTSLRGFAATAASPTLRREMLGRRCNLRGLTGWIEPLNAWLGEFLTRRWSLHGLPDAQGRAPTLALQDLPPRQVQVELEFWLESRRVETGAVDALVQSHVLVGQRRPGLETMQLNGMLKGFIDLVFEHEGRYYVVDWKSNWLGSDDAAYTAEAMGAAMLHARYDLQYVLYLLALHRQLLARLPDYDYDRHIGGALYAFLRGGYSDSQGLYMDKPPRVLIETLDRLFAGAITEERAA
jgi:exodeoxyribonuclease V beta subunit